MTSKTADGTTRGQSPRGRVSYQHVFQAQINKKYPDKPAKYSVVLIFDKDTDFTAMKAAAEEALKKKWPNKRPLELKNPFRDGNIKDDKPEYADKIFVTFSTYENPDPDFNPKVVDGKNRRIHQEDGTFYNGCYARVSFNAAAFDTDGNRGVAFYLNNIQKVADGEKISSRVAVENEFDACEGEDTGGKELTF